MDPQITCPSGLSGTIRGLKVKEANMLADVSSLKRGTSVDQVLASVWLETSDPGPYTVTSPNKIDWSKVLVADRFYVLLMSRVLTYGPAYDFDWQCPEEACRHKNKISVDLLEELPVKLVPTESLAVFVSDNRFPTTIPSTKRKCWFQLLTGEGERAASLRAKQNRTTLMTVALASRIVEIDGVHANDRLRFLEDLPMDDAVKLIDQLDAMDGGVQTDTEVECASCLCTQDIKLPFGKTFWMPLQSSSRAQTI